jgi:transposase
MGEVLSRDWELRSQAARREHVAIGGTCALLLTLIEEQPDLTLDEVVSAMHKHGIAGSRTAVWSFFKRHNISFKKKPARRGAGSPRRGPGTSMLEATASHA